MNISSYVVGNSNDKNYFLPKFLLTNAQVSRLCKAFANNSLANIKLSKFQLHKTGQSGDFLETFMTFTKNWVAFNRK